MYTYLYIYLYIHPITNLGEEWRNADCYGVIFLGRRVDPALADICRKRDRCCHPLVGRSAVCSATENFCLKNICEEITQATYPTSKNHQIRMSW